ncbi:MAG: hypothetical protein R2847_00400 [Bacteroidia bacterium]
MHCLLTIPDAIEIDVTPLTIGQAVKISMVQRENITLLDSPNNIIVAVRTTRNVGEKLRLLLLQLRTCSRCTAAAAAKQAK